MPYPMKPQNNKQDETSDIYTHFIDILFAIVIGQSFVLINSPEGYKYWWTRPRENLFGIVTLILIYGLVITSWIGYHRSIRKFPIKTPSRFLVDISLLFVYYMGFVNANDFQFVLVVFFASFLLYFVWDLLRLFEYQKDMLKLGLIKRSLISLIFWFFFLVIYLLYVYALREMEWTYGAYIIIILTLLVLYRYLKWR